MAWQRRVLGIAAVAVLTATAFGAQKDTCAFVSQKPAITPASYLPKHETILDTAKISAAAKVDPSTAAADSLLKQAIKPAMAPTGKDRTIDAIVKKIRKCLWRLKLDHRPAGLWMDQNHHLGLSGSIRLENEWSSVSSLTINITFNFGGNSHTVCR